MLFCKHLMLQHLTKALYVGLSFTLISVHSLVSRTVSSKLGASRGQAVVFQRYFLRNILEICFVWGFYLVFSYYWEL